jgi:hypothetical protein
MKLWPFGKKEEEPSTDSEYIKLLKKRQKLEDQKPDKPANIYDIASGGLTLALGITVLALGSAATFGAPAIAVGLLGASYAIYQEYSRIKLNKAINATDKTIEEMEKTGWIDSQELALGREIKNTTKIIENKKRKISNFLEIAVGTYGTTLNTLHIVTVGTVGVAGALLPYASIAIAVAGVCLFGYKEYKRRQEEKNHEI